MRRRERVKWRQMKVLNVNGEALNDDVKALKGVKGQLDMLNGNKVALKGDKEQWRSVKEWQRCIKG